MQKYPHTIVLAVLFATLAFAADHAAPNDAALYFKAGEQAARAGDSMKAYLLYVQAARLKPANSAFRERKLAMQSSAALQGRRLGLTDVDPANETSAAKLELEGLTGGEKLEADRAEPPVTLVGAPGRQTFDLRGDSRTVAEKVAAAFGIQLVFDAAYQPVPAMGFRVADVTYQEALRILEKSSDSFLVPMSSNLALMARDTAQNRTQFAPTMSVVVPIPERISSQEAQEIATAVQQTMEIRRITLDSAKRVVYFRDSVPKVLAAREMFSNLARLRGQIEVDVEFVTVSRTSSLSYGLSLPTASSIVDFSRSLAGFVLNAPAAGNFLAIGGGATFLGLGIANSGAFATLSRASSESVLKSQLFGLDGEAATLHIGDRYPVITGTFEGLTTDTNVSQTLSPTINYQDLGLVLKITPAIHTDGEITLDVDAQFKTLGVGGANGIPVIASRQYQGKVRMKQGEWAVLAGLVSTTETDTTSGIAGLSNLPGIGGLFSRRTKLTESSDTLLVLKPRIVAMPPWEQTTSTIWTGSQTRPITPF